MKPREYPDYDKLEACEITLRDKESGHLTQISIDDLFEAFKDELLERGFQQETESNW